MTVFLGCDDEGLAGMRQCLGYIAQNVPVRLAWTDKMFGGRFKGRTPQSLKTDEWKEVSDFLRVGVRQGWSVG